jgi:hypothetical protein
MGKDTGTQGECTRNGGGNHNKGKEDQVMSHISKIELEVRDLGVLGAACRRLGLELVRDQKTFAWYGSPEACDHVIKVAGAHYEIGIRKTGSVYELVCDYFDQAIGRAIGRGGGLLKQAYAVEKTRVQARKKGYLAVEKPTETGIQVRIRMP